MKQFGIQQSGIGVGLSGHREEMRSPISVSVMVTDRRETMVCPKPRRFGLFNPNFNDHHPVRSLRWQLGHQAELCDSKSGSDPLDIILSKGGCGVEQSCTQVASSPPIFYGSPPSRVANPLIQDARFGDEKLIAPLSPLSAIPPPSGSSSSSSSSPRKGGCVRANFGNKPMVRVEGFDCLDRDNRRNCSIPALA